MGKLAVFVSWALLAGAVLVSGASAQNFNDVVGTWKLASSISELDGKKTDQFGSGAKGMLILDAGGRFMFTIIGADLPKFASNNRANGTADENKAVVGKSIAVFGTYSVSPADKTLTFRIEAATFPNWDTTEQKRILIAVSGDELKYVTARASNGGIGTVTWKRAE
jgi:hypothetical protein